MTAAPRNAQATGEIQYIQIHQSGIVGFLIVKPLNSTKNNTFNPAIGVATNAFGASSEMHWKYEDIAKPNNAVMSRNPP